MRLQPQQPKLLPRQIDPNTHEKKEAEAAHARSTSTARSDDVGGPFNYLITLITKLSGATTISAITPFAGHYSFETNSECWFDL